MTSGHLWGVLGWGRNTQKPPGGSFYGHIWPYWQHFGPLVGSLVSCCRALIWAPSKKMIIWPCKRHLCGCMQPSRSTGRPRLPGRQDFGPYDCHSCLNLRPWVTSVVPVEPLVWLRWPMERVWAGGLDYAVGGTAEALRRPQAAQLYYKAGLTPGNPCRRLSHLPTSSTFEP